mmetsp:Transcript_13845/g.33526  ORF Transcript_13845/g.33526 Transcript_13845/m.33526 type:complete len:96 (-) Transcript_13845:291-578(-)
MTNGFCPNAMLVSLTKDAKWCFKLLEQEKKMLHSAVHKLEIKLVMMSNDYYATSIHQQKIAGDEYRLSIVLSEIMRQSTGYSIGYIVGIFGILPA